MDEPLDLDLGLSDGQVFIQLVEDRLGDPHGIANASLFERALPPPQAADEPLGADQAACIRSRLEDLEQARLHPRREAIRGHVASALVDPDRPRRDPIQLRSENVGDPLVVGDHAPVQIAGNHLGVERANDGDALSRRGEQERRRPNEIGPEKDRQHRIGRLDRLADPDEPAVDLRLAEKRWQLIQFLALELIAIMRVHGASV